MLVNLPECGPTECPAPEPCYAYNYFLFTVTSESCDADLKDRLSDCDVLNSLSKEVLQEYLVTLNVSQW